MLQKNTIKEIGYMLVGLLILTAFMVGIFALVGYFSLSVLWGAFYGCFLALLNFILLAYTVEKAVNKSEKHAKAYMSSSYTVRMVLLAVGIIIGFKNPQIFHYLAVVIPIVFPRLIIMLRQIIINKSTKKGAVE